MKFYSTRQIFAASFLGTPLFGGFLLRKNFITLGDKLKGNTALVLSFVFTGAIFFFLYSFSEKFQSASGFSLPIFYSLIMEIIARRSQGKKIELAIKNGATYRSNYGVFLPGILITVLIGGIAFYAKNEAARLQKIIDADPSYKYVPRLEEFLKNEKIGLKIFELLEDQSVNDTEIHSHLTNKAIPAWRANIELIGHLRQEYSNDAHFLKILENFEKQSSLRLNQLELFEKAIKENSGAYQGEIDKLEEQINQLIKENEQLFNQAR